MEGQLKVTPEELQNASSEFSTIDNTVLNTTSEMMTLVKNLTSAWEGESSQSYISKFNELEDAAMQAIESVHKHDGRPYKAIVHIEDNMIGETIETYENSDDVIIL